MSIELDKKSKTYTVRWYQVNQKTGERLQKKKRGFKTKKEARLFEDEVQTQNQYAAFKQLSDLYIESLIGYSNEETRLSKSKTIDRYMSDLLNKDVRKISNLDVIDWKNKLVNLNLSITTKNRIIQLLKAVSKYGSEYFDYPDFAKTLKSLPKKSDDVKDINVISQEDLQTILENIPNEVYRRFIAFLYYTGVRRGEALGLLKSDIQGNTVTINKAIRRPSAGHKSLKNKSSKRTILLSEKALGTIKPLLDTEGEYLFGEHRPLSTTQIARQFEQGLNGANLEHHRIHDLRHSFISNAILNGLDIVTVSKYVGHSNIEQTLNTYSHLLKDSEKMMIDKLNKIF